MPTLGADANFIDDAMCNAYSKRPKIKIKLFYTNRLVIYVCNCSFYSVVPAYSCVSLV